MDTTKLDVVISELLERHAHEKTDPPEFKERMLAMGSEGGRFVETIVRATRPKRGLEIGTSSGYSALCAMRGDEKKRLELVTVDFDPAKAAWARENFERACVGGRIKIVVADGLEAARMIEGPFEYVLLDAAKSQTLPIMKELLPKLSVGAVVLTDNMLTHSEELKEFAHFVRHHPDLSSNMFEIGNGIEVTVKLSPPLTDKVVLGDAMDRVRRGGAA